MKILIDIGHPAHVHYFKNFIKKMKSKEHKFLIVARDRGVIKDLLIKQGFEFVNRGKGSDSLLGKFTYMFIANSKILKIALKFKPDLFLSFSSPYAAQVSFLLRKPHIAITDTEHADRLLSKFTYPFSSWILTPQSYINDLGKKHLKFKSVVESFYLNSNYFSPDKDIKKYLNIANKENYIIIRFVSWKAHHDIGQKGLDIETTKKLIKILEPNFKIFISSEDKFPIEFIKYKLNISPNRMHDVLASAFLFIGESATMASESALLGTFAVYINSLPLMGYLKAEQDAGLLKYFNNSDGVMEYVTSLVGKSNLKEESIVNSIKFQENFIDSTKFLTWFIENYPESAKIMKEDSNYQLKFR